MALDLGGTNFRVILLTLEPGSELKSIVTYYKVPEEVRLGEGEAVSIFFEISVFHSVVVVVFFSKI